MSATKGPWKVGQPPRNYPAARSRLVISDIRLVAEFQNEDDATLGAAAPDLLEVCKRLIHELEGDGGVSVGCEEDARAAIKKAEGAE